MRDLRHALRQLAKTPGFTAVALLTLALGIGASTTVFSWIERVLLNPIPGIADASRIVALETRSPSGELIDTSYPDFHDYRAQAKTLSHVFVYKERPLNLGTGAATERVWSQLVSGNFFDALGLRPRLGRFFAAADRADEPAAAPVVVISESLWRRRFAADPTILGRTIKLNQQDFTVIGVTPAPFIGTLNGLAFEAWVPVMLHTRLTGMSSWLESRGWRALHTLARLAPGATLESARAELAAISGQLSTAHPDTNRNFSLVPMKTTDSPIGVHRELARPLLVLLGVTGLLLLIVCANLSNLLLVRASARQREMCIRQALGAGWVRLVRQLLAESIVLSGGGALLGLLFTMWMSDTLRRFIPAAELPISLDAQLSGPVLALAIGLSTVTALLAGFAPALWAARPNLTDVLRASGRTAAVSRHADFFRRMLVIAQVATAIVTLTCAGLAAKSFFAAKRVYPGFESSGVLLAALRLDTSGYSREQSHAFLARLIQRLPELPGIESAALAEDVPLGLSRGSWEELVIPGYVRASNEEVRVYRNRISPGYFSVMRIPLLHGREFTAADDDKSPFVAIVNETFARRYLGGENAVGRTFSMWGGRRELTVVGVARDTKVHALGEGPTPFYYVPLRQFLTTDMGIAIHLRSAAIESDPMNHLPALRSFVRELDPNLPIFDAITLDDFISAARFAQKAAASLLGVLSGIALALTSLGLYGVLAFSVAQRVPEIGVRLALGAQARDIARLVLTRGAALIGIGVGIGILAALVAARGMAHVLPRVNAFEPLLLLGVAALVILSSLFACWLPARRASRVDPMTALRSE
jgi:macrolide transport system ATP-binding/permease protein